MPTTLDCNIMRNLFGSDRMREVFDSRRLLQAWLDVWAALAEAEADAGLIPVSAAQTIRGVAKAERYDLDQIGREIKEGQHLLMPSINALSKASGEAGKYVHWGTTTQDITDTGLVLQIRAALDLIEPQVRDTIKLLSGYAERYKAQPMAGRTHWQHAVPITFGLKIAQWVDELIRNSERLARCRTEVLVAQMFGACGTMAALGADGARVQAAFSKRIGLPLPNAPWYVQRDRFAELVSQLGILAGTMERIIMEVGRLSATEIGEVHEGRKKGLVGSSTMPQKHNPIIGERACAGFKFVRGLVPVMQSLMIVGHERDMSATSGEWLLLPQCFITLDGALVLAHGVLERMQVHPQKMMENLALTKGGIVAEAVMFGLAKHFGRNHAHDMSLLMAREASEKNCDLLDVLMANDEVRGALSESELRALVDPTNYLGQAEEIVEDVVRSANGGGGRRAAEHSS